MGAQTGPEWMFAVDLDGNLDREDEACLVLLQELRRRGMRRFAIATAHPKFGLRVRKLGRYYEADYLVLENGSIVLERAEDGWRDVVAWLALTKDTTAGLAALCDEFLRRVTVIEESKGDYADPPCDVKMVRLPSGEGPVRFEDSSGSFQLHSKDPAIFQQTVAFARSLVTELGLKVYEVMDATSLTYGSASKGEGVAFVAGLGSPRLSVVAMGDSINDLTMLSSCDLPCAPANALPVVKELVQSRGGILAAAQRIEAVKEVLAHLPARLGIYKVET